MEIKPPYPVTAPDKQLALIAKKGRSGAAVFDPGNEVKEVTLQNQHIEDIVDISANDIIRIDLTYQKNNRFVRGHSSLMSSFAPDRKGKGALIDVWV
ncbi:MAG: hypothetical protein WC405_17475 [Syntrophales bacterium]